MAWVLLLHLIRLSGQTASGGQDLDAPAIAQDQGFEPLSPSFLGRHQEPLAIMRSSSAPSPDGCLSA